MSSLKEIAEKIKAKFGLVALALGVLDCCIFPIVPISPLLRGAAAIFTIIFGLIAINYARSYSDDLLPNPRRKAKLRRCSLILTACGIAVIVIYYWFLGFTQQHPVRESIALFYVLDASQAILYALPWAIWSGAFVMLIEK